MNKKMEKRLLIKQVLKKGHKVFYIISINLIVSDGVNILMK